MNTYLRLRNAIHFAHFSVLSNAVNVRFNLIESIFYVKLRFLDLKWYTKWGKDELVVHCS